jgi:tetratricopeptide (TPR) repeat protein
MEKDGSRSLNAQTSSVPLIARLAHQIPKPNAWQALQRGCVLLFRAELNDPNAQEYGRNGQAQGGIDVLGRRNNDPGHFVGIQCRHIAKPIKQAKILEDCREALTLKAELKEIIFATTAKNDTVATDAAIAVEKLLRSEGHDLAVVVYGWESLQTLIAVHEVAYHAFSPSALATTAHQSLVISGALADSLAMQIAAQVSEQLRQGGLSVSSPEVGDVTATDEDPALHARIDTFRDLFKDHSQPVLARKGLLALIEKETLDAKPWARFRIETNLASIALDLGQEEEAATRFESAHATRPDDPNATANLAIALIIKRRFPEAMDTAQKALDAEPRADHAVAYLLQAAARSDWPGDADQICVIQKGKQVVEGELCRPKHRGRIAPVEQYLHLGRKLVKDTLDVQAVSQTVGGLQRRRQAAKLRKAAGGIAAADALLHQFARFQHLQRGNPPPHLAALLNKQMDTFSAVAKMVFGPVAPSTTSNEKLALQQPP